MKTPTTKGRWRPGQTGNPNGRPVGTGKVAQLRASIEAKIPEILESLVKSAVDGDGQLGGATPVASEPALLVPIEFIAFNPFGFVTQAVPTAQVKHGHRVAGLRLSQQGVSHANHE